MQRIRNAISINPLQPTKLDWLNQSQIVPLGAEGVEHISPSRKAGDCLIQLLQREACLIFKQNVTVFPSLNEEIENLFYKSHPITTQMYISFFFHAAFYGAAMFHIIFWTKLFLTTPFTPVRTLLQWSQQRARFHRVLELTCYMQCHVMTTPETFNQKTLSYFISMIGHTWHILTLALTIAGR